MTAKYSSWGHSKKNKMLEEIHHESILFDMTFFMHPYEVQ